MKEGTGKERKQRQSLSRRSFLGTAAAGAAAFTVVPRSVLGGSGTTPPSEKLNIAGVGIGGMGKNNVNAVSSQNIVALCDVDEKYASKVFKKYPKAKVWTDYRKMLDKQKEIDAVICATPDHSHAKITMDAMKRGKHVYTQKPLTHSVWEARQLAEAQKKYNVTTQMGNQGNSGEGVRLVCEWIWSGAIGDVRRAYSWTNRPIWPQGQEKLPKGKSAPDHIAWDLWCGPAPNHGYNSAYHPFSWRGWWDYGCGALGDMGCHIMDPPYWALKLGNPDSVEGSTTGTSDVAAPNASIIHYHFPARDGMPPCEFTWYDGGLKPPRPPELPDDQKLPSNGTRFMGEKGTLICGTYGGGPHLIPASKMADFDRPEKSIPRVNSSHEMAWVNAAKKGEQPSSNFSYSGPLTEVVVLGNLACRMPGKLHHWDADNMRIKGDAKATGLLRDEYRDGWSL